jgi:hypothetical protein
MPFAILRTQKLSTNTSVRGSLKHALRTQKTLNADPSKLSENSFTGAQNIEEAMSKYQSLLPEKVRSNGVRCIEYLMTGSPDHMAKMSRETQDSYFSDCLKWLQKKHGVENVVCSGIHRDETTPHLYAYVVPIDERGKLNCRAFLGGRDALSKMQTEFAEEVSQKYGLERGIEGSTAKHQKISDFYKSLDQERVEMPPLPVIDPSPAILKKSLFFPNVVETSEEVKIRINRSISEDRVDIQMIVRSVENQARSFKYRAARAEKELERMPRELRALPKKELEHLASAIALAKKEQKRTSERDRGR